MRSSGSSSSRAPDARAIARRRSVRAATSSRSAAAAAAASADGGDGASCFLPKKEVSDDDCTASFLAADLSVEFFKDWHRLAVGYAVAMIPIWPLGVPAFMLVMFLRNRHGIAALRDEQHRHEASVTLQESSLSTRRGSKDILRGIQRQLETRHGVEHVENVEAIKAKMADRRWIEGRIKAYELRCA